MRFSLKYKTILGLSILFLMAFLSSNYIINKVVNKNNEDMITRELIDIKKNSIAYTRQFFMINSIKVDSQGFIISSGKISKELSEKVGIRVNVYSDEGRILSSSTQGEYQEFEGSISDLKVAISGRSGYNINHNQDRTYVNYSFPITLDSKVIGIIRCTKDYTYLFQGGEKLLMVYKASASVLFAVIFLFTYIISVYITKPILELAKCSEEVAVGNYKMSIRNNYNDEIGELLNNFQNMVYQIQTQLSTIEKDRDTLKEIEKQRKVFFDNVTHELKTPLTTILGYAQILEQNGFSDEEFFYKGIAHIQNESNRLHKMVLELLQISRENAMDITDIEFQTIDISTCILSTCEEMKVKSKKYGTELITEIQRPLIVYGNVQKIKDVLINLIDNSIKYGDINSKIIVTAINGEEYVSISITDEGKGIPKDETEKIFQPFYRVGKKQNQEGSGLGLSIVKGIVDKHKGEIKVISEINKGSTFVVRIPCKQQK